MRALKRDTSDSFIAKNEFQTKLIHETNEITQDTKMLLGQFFYFGSAAIAEVSF